MDNSQNTIIDITRDKYTAFITAPNNTPATNAFLSSLADSNHLHGLASNRRVNFELTKLMDKLNLSPQEEKTLGPEISAVLDDIRCRYNDLPGNLYRRLRALIKIERIRIEHEINYLSKLSSITDTYNSRVASFYEVRNQLLNNNTEPKEGDMCQPLRTVEVEDDESQIYFANFWSEVFSDCSYLGENDVEFFSYIQDMYGYREFPTREVLTRAVEIRRQLFEYGKTDSSNFPGNDIFAKTILKFKIAENPFIPAGWHEITAFSDAFTNQVRFIVSSVSEVYPAFNFSDALRYLLLPMDSKDESELAYETNCEIFNYINELLSLSNAAILEYTGESIIDILQCE